MKVSTGDFPTLAHMILISMFILIWTISLNGQRKFYPSSFDCDDAIHMYVTDQDLAYSINPSKPNSDFPFDDLCFGGGVPHNLGWYKFVTDGGPIVFNIQFNPGDCDFAQGIQAGIMDDCAGTRVMDCNASCNNSTFSLSFNSEKNQDYYLWVDGCNGDVCEFEFTVSKDLVPPRGYRPYRSTYYKDKNDNCDFDVNENIQTGCQTTFIDRNGLTQNITFKGGGYVNLPFGEYLSVSNHSNIPFEFCPDSLHVNIDSLPFSYQRDIGVTINLSCPLLSFNIVPPSWINRFRCNPQFEKTLTIEYFNDGTIATLNDVAILTLDVAMKDIEIDHPLTKLNSLEYAISLQDLQPGQKGIIEIKYKLICASSDIGRQLCITIEDEIYACSPDVTMGSNDQFCGTIRNSFDPNDIVVLPPGETDQRYIEKDETLEYIIRFENTGNDTAYDVVIELNTGIFDPKSVVMGFSSHPTVAIYPTSPSDLIKFHLLGINLVDSTTNKEASQGYLKLELKLDDPDDYELVEHQANIFFDYNPPIQTNKEFHTIAPPFVLINKKVDLCHGEEFNNIQIFSDTTIVDKIVVAGPDSIIVTEIFVHPNYNIEIDTLIKSGDTIWDIVIDTDTFIQRLFLSVWSCDSNVTYHAMIDGTVHVDNVLKTNIEVYPNPVYDNHVFISIDEQSGHEMEMIFYSLDGRIVQKQFLSAGLNRVAINQNVLSQILYYRITGNNEEVLEFGKIIKL